MESIDSEEVHVISRVCQCCLDGSGDLKSMLQEYTYNGIQEVYQDMLHECLSIQIPIPLSGASDMLICTSCINNLRKITIFRQQIEDSQRKMRNLEKLQESISSNSLVKEECPSDAESNYVSYDSEDFSLKTHRRNKILITKQSNSEDVLQKALERTQKNLQLLKNTFSDKKLEVIKSIRRQVSQNRDASDSEPEDDVERRRYLGRKRYASNIPFKLEKTDRTCKVCSETFPSNKGLVLHMPTHYPNYVCNECGKLFVLKTHLDRHVAHTHDTTKVACPTCNKLIKKDSLRRHVRVHTGDHYTYKCYVCSEKFTSYRLRINHMSDKHGHKTNEYKCTVCWKIFRISGDLSKHMKSVHLGEKKHKCTECDQHFFSKNKLGFHMLKHTKERNYECEVCHKRYGRKFTLREHMKIHNNVKNHVCSICDRAFTQKCTLQAHIKTHEVRD